MPAPFMSENKGLFGFAQRLHLDRVLHHGGVVLHRHRGKHAVDGVFQLGVALLHGDADVDLFLGDLKVTVGAGEVEQLQARICGACGQSGRLIRDHQIDLARRYGDDRVAGGFLRGQLVRVRDLIQAVVPDGIDLRGAGRAVKIGDGCGVRVFAVRLGQRHDGGVVVRLGEVDALQTLGRDGLAGDDAVHGAGDDGGNEGIPILLIDLEIHIERFGDLFRHHDVVAVSVGVAVLDRHGAVGVGVLRPVIGGVGAFHRHAQHFAVGVGGLLAAACKQTADEHHECENECNLSFHEFSNPFFSFCGT